MSHMYAGPRPQQSAVAPRVTHGSPTAASIHEINNSGNNGGSGVEMYATTAYFSNAMLKRLQEACGEGNQQQQQLFSHIPPSCMNNSDMTASTTAAAYIGEKLAHEGGGSGGSLHRRSHPGECTPQRGERQRRERLFGSGGMSPNQRGETRAAAAAGGGDGDTQALENSLATLQLYSRYCEVTDAEKGNLNPQYVQNSNNNFGSSNNNNNSDTGGSMFSQANVATSRFLEAENVLRRNMAVTVGGACSQPQTPPTTAFAKATHSPSKTKSSGGVALRAKKAEHHFQLNRLREESKKKKEKIQSAVKQTSTNQVASSRIIAWSAPGNKSVPKAQKTTRLEELRAVIATNDIAVSPPQQSLPQAQTAKKSKKNNKGSTRCEDLSLPSRLEEIRQHIEKYSASNDEVAARPLYLRNADITRVPMPGVPTVRVGVFPGMSVNNQSRLVQPLSESVFSGSALPHPQGSSLHIVFDTCSLLEANTAALEALMQRSTVCIPFGVIAELDKMNTGKSGPRGRGKTDPRKLSFAVRKVRDWITSCIEARANIRVQRRCEVDVLYDRKAATNDDSILGFAVFLEKQRLTVEFVTEDKFLRVKAVTELKGRVCNFGELMERHHHHQY